MADAAAEALAVLERIQDTAPAEPVEHGPSVDEVASAICEATERDPAAPIDVDPDRARQIRELRGLNPDTEISNLDAAAAHVIEARAQDHWRDLDAIAKREGWDRADFATAHWLHHNEPAFVAWEDGRPHFDPAYTPPQPEFGSRTPATIARAVVDTDRLFDAGLREAVRVSREAASAARATRGVEIRVGDASINRY